VRVLLATLTLVPILIAAAPAASEQQPEVTVKTAVIGPRPDREDRMNPLGRRQWDVGFRVTVSSDRTCDQLRFTYRAADLFDGTLGLDRTYGGGDATSKPAQTAGFDVVSSNANTGDTIAFTATGFCILGGASFQSQPLRLRIPIPPHSCDEGPLRVLRLHGRAWREDLQVINKRVRLRTRHFIREAYTGWLARRSRIVFGAPKCDGFRIALRGGRAFLPGAYQRHGSGVMTATGRGALARFVGDQHAGGIETENALVRPAGRPADARRVASFEVYSYPRKAGRLTRVRVFRGVVSVQGGPGAGALSAPILVPSGYATIVRCTAYRSCRPDPPHRG
jgi:hypothetical protein